MVPSCSLAVVLFDIVTGGIVGVDLFTRWMFAPEFVIANVQVLGDLVGVLTLLIKLILGVLILIVSIIDPNRHFHPFLLPPSLF